MKVLFVDFSHLRNIPEPFKSELTATTMKTIRSKYEGTSVFITDSQEAAKIANSDGAMNTIRIHNMPELDNNDPALGNAIPEINTAEVNLEDFINQGFGTTPEILGEQIGTVASHEGFHLLGPSGHSVLVDNLMSDGELTSDSLVETGGANLEFTDLQKAILNGDLDETTLLKLSEIEEVYSEWLEDIVSSINIDIDDLFVEFLDSIL